MQSAYNEEIGDRRNSFVRFIVSSHPVDYRIEHRSKVTLRLLGDKLPKTWMYSDPLRRTKCSCVSTVGVLSDLNAMNERTNEERQREILRIVSLRFYQSQKSWVASYYQPWAPTTPRLEHPPSQLLFDMLLRCRNTRDMSAVMCLCEYYRPDSNIWESLARAPNDNFVNEKLHLQHSIQRVGIPEDIGYRCESSYEHDGRSPMERLVAQIVRYYTSEIYGSSCELTATVRARRVIDETRDRFFADECSVRREKPPSQLSTTAFACEEQGNTGRYYIRQYMRQYKLKRNGCAFDADELKECVRNSHFKNGQLDSFEKLNNYFNDSSDDGIDSNDDHTDDETAEAYHDQPLTFSFRGLPASPSHYGETHHIARFPDFIGETWRRYIWQQLTPLGFARITKQIWHTLIPFDRRQFDAYDNFTLCRKVHCEQSRSLVRFCSRHYDREGRENREALYTVISRKRTRTGSSEESTNARSMADISASSGAGVTMGSESWLNLAIDPSKIVDSEATMRTGVSVGSSTNNAIGDNHHLEDEITEDRSNDDRCLRDSIVTLVPGIRLLRDYGDWNSVWFVAILFDRVLNDLNEYSVNPRIFGDGIGNDDDDIGEESSYLTPPPVTSATMTERWRVWRRLLNYALANDLRHALAPLHVFFRRDELRRKLESTANAEVSRTMVSELSTITITTSDQSDGTADKIREHTARCYFHENRSAGLEWCVVDSVRSGGIAPPHLYENNRTNSRARDDVLEIMRSVSSKYHLRNHDHSDGDSSLATNERNDQIVDSSSVLLLAANATIPSAITAEAQLSFMSVRATARQEDRGTLLATSLRKCFEYHGLTNREVLRIPVFQRYARDIIERIREYYICEVLIRRGGSPSCRDISFDVAGRITRNRTNVSDEDLIVADAILREQNEAEIGVAGGGNGSGDDNGVPRRWDECWSSFLVDSV